MENVINNKNNYFKEIDILKGIAILTVILEHSFSVKYVDLTNIQWCTTCVTVIKSFNMQLFFMISGFLFANSKILDICKAYISKIDRLLIPYIFISLINLVAIWGLPSVINGDKRNDIWETIYLLLLYGDSYWFVYTLFMIFCIVIPLKKYLNPPIVIIIILVLVGIKELHFVQTDMLQLNHVFYHATFFLFGFLAYKNYDIIRKILKKPIIILLCLGLYFVLFRYKYDLHFVYYWILPILLDIVTIGIGLCLVNLSYDNPMLKYFGRNSLQFYMFNGYALVLTRIFWAKLLSIKQPIILIAFVFLSSLLVLVILVEITKRIPGVSYLCGFGRKNKQLFDQKMRKQK